MAENGVSRTDPFGEGLSGYGSLKDFGVDDKYLKLAEAISGKPREFDPAMAAFLYFSRMGELASQPGATLFGSAAGAASSPAEYLLKLQEEKREREASVPGTAINLMKALKPTASELQLSPLAKAKRDYEAGRLTEEEYNALLAKLTNIPGETSKFTARTVYKDGTEKKVYSQEDYDKAINTEGWSDTKPAGEETPQWVTVTETVPSTEEGEESTTRKSTKLLTPTEINELSSDANKTVTKMESLFTYKDIRDAYSKDQDFKDFKALQTNFDKVNTSYEQAYQLDSPKVADLSMIFAYMKMLDPRSVVREGEQQQARGTGGLFDLLANTYNSLLGEGSLTDMQRKSFRDGAFAFYTKNATLLEELNGRIIGEASNQNIQNVEDFIIIPKTFKDDSGKTTLKVFARYPGDDKLRTIGNDELTFLLTAQTSNRLTEENKAKIRAEIRRRTQRG